MANKKNNKQKEKVIKDFELQIKKIETALDSLSGSVNLLQNGDGEQPYWNGSNAYNELKKVLAYIDSNMVLVKYLNECKDSIK